MPLTSFPSSTSQRDKTVASNASPELIERGIRIDCAPLLNCDDRHAREPLDRPISPNRVNFSQYRRK